MLTNNKPTNPAERLQQTPSEIREQAKRAAMHANNKNSVVKAQNKQIEVDNQKLLK